MIRSFSAGIGLAAVLGASGAIAHTPLCACYDNGDGTVLCEGGFSDGSSAAGVAVRVVGIDGSTLLEAEMSEYSEFEFDKPDGDYRVVFDAGPGHAVEIASSDIVE
ncbi:hypothetical protein F2Q65_03970 [Thiohalocapsa marina]|uniref:Carboxypeptidase regulatory-like domain-containing protein n=2 Tax=Thiohalocapsa marina TaxID=424902 RepID=A0A5M8FTF9_9GAMM|nr:hypothetical protein F2Q65_03970 [Thiohalocapsa marina]